MELDIYDVQQLFPHTDYIRGMQYYHQKRVKHLRWEAVQGRHRVCCQVRGSALYDVSFEEVAPGQLDGDCTCPRFEDMGLCKHLAAAMICFVLDKPRDAPPMTDRQARELLQLYLNSDTAPADLGTAHLIPLLRHGYYSRMEYPSFSFRVGREKSYVVKDIRAFLDHVDKCRVVSYGKGLTLDHSMESFDEFSQAWIRLLMDQFDEFRSHGRSYGSYGYRPGYEKNEITLTGTAFDRAFDLLQQNPGSGIRCEEADPQIILELEKGEDRAFLSIMAPEDCHFFGNSRVLYAKNENTLLRCSDAFRRRVLPLLQRQKRMQFAFSDLPALCGSVLPQLTDMVTLQDPHGLMQAYLPEECTPCFYFDMEDNALLLKLTFRYDTREIAVDTPTAQTEHIRRDMRTEQLARNAAERFFPAESHWRMENEDAIFRFLTGQIDTLHQYGQVYISDRLRNKRIQHSQVGIGISVSGGLLELELELGEFPPEELAALYQSLLKRRKYHRLEDGRYLELEGSGYEKLAEISHMLQLTPKALQKGKLTLPAFRALYLDSVLGGSEGLQIKRDQAFRSMVRSFKSVADGDHRLPDHLEPILRPYQKTGFQWLKTLESAGFGGILADEMGLGKTLQVIAWLCSIDRQAVGFPSLVVCPTSLILNWGAELEKFAPTLRCTLIYGTAAERKRLRDASAAQDVWVTSYELLRQDVEDYEKLQFYGCVLDEGQHIKNQSTLMSRAVKQIDCRQRFVLTGTPIENRLSELWNLFDFLMPGYLYSHTAFRDKLEKPIIKTRDDQAAAQLRKLVQPFLLRRLKQDVLKELPPKISHVRRISLSEDERKIYQASLQAACASVESGSGKLQILAALTQLRQICCDPGLCFENFSGRSSKLEACLELCSGMVENGHQILLFSQFTSMLDRLRLGLEELGIPSFTLQGSTPKEKRAQLVRDFNAGKASVFLISLKAGGTGLNLTAADVVIHFDPWWNLAAQEQATDRAHRIGQRAHVQVYRLITQNTIEEKILELQDRKAALMDAISGETDGSILTMSKEDLLELLQ